VNPELQHTVALLQRTPASLDALLRGLPPGWTANSEGEGTWSVHGILGHLVHGERTDWMPRVRHLLEHGESRPFALFNRTAFMEFAAERPVGELLDDFALARRASLDELHAMDLQPADMARIGLHPSFGPVSLGQLLSTWATHDLTHLHQISRVMAYQYREAVGPWSAFLGVLHCTGHSG
jgi:hypothetical protein